MTDKACPDSWGGSKVAVLYRCLAIFFALELVIQMEQVETFDRQLEIVELTLVSKQVEVESQTF